jgi:hypothetical protein
LANLQTAKKIIAIGSGIFCLSLNLFVSCAANSVWARIKGNDSLRGMPGTVPEETAYKKPFVVKNSSCRVTVTPRLLTVTDASGREIFNSRKVAMAHATKILKAEAKDYAPKIIVNETYSLNSVVGPFVCLSQEIEIDHWTKKDEPIGAHPTVRTRYLAIDCRHPENIADRAWGDKERHTQNECLLQNVFAPSAIKEALLNSDNTPPLAEDFAQQNGNKSFAKLVKVLESSLLSSAQGGTMMNRFEFDSYDKKAKTIKVVLGIEGGPHDEITPYDLTLKVPASLKKAVGDATTKKGGILKCDIPASCPGAYHNVLWQR